MASPALHMGTSTSTIEHSTNHSSDPPGSLFSEELRKQWGKYKAQLMGEMGSCYFVISRRRTIFGEPLSVLLANNRDILLGLLTGQ